VTANRFYSRKVLELFLRPPGAGTLDHPDGVGSAVNPACSDRATIAIRVAAGKIVEARFQTQGCAAAIAAGAATVLLVEGRSIEDAEALGTDDVVRYLDGLPEAKIGCSVIAPEALRRAIADWRSRQESRDSDG
jgi:NifU-like protein involved in Fe-S cluster formation